MNFRQSVEYLLSLGNEVSAMKHGLESIRTLLNALGDPQKNYKKIQVAGTNGKGSVCAFLDSTCYAAGIPTGLYTSPHLVSITERVRINGADISEDEFARLATLVRGTSETLVADGGLESVPTFFEQVTAIALKAFADAGVELAILETGLGGRLDATTAAEAGIAVITPVALDHQEYLGDTIEQIASEKAAIIRPNTRSAVISAQPPEAMNVILDRCDAENIQPIIAADIPARWNNGDADIGPYRGVKFGLPGRHQLENAITAVLAAQALRSEGFRIKDADITRGLEAARHPGRLEYIGQFLLDGAHNPAGARALRAYLDEFVQKPVTLIFGAMREKDIAAIADQLFDKAGTIILTRPDNTRALLPEDIAGQTSDLINTVPLLTNSVAEAVQTARQATPPGGVILVTGSLYLVGEARGILKQSSQI